MRLVPAWARRTLVEPTWTAANGSSFLRTWRELERTQYLPLSVLQERQEMQLRRLTADACRDTEFYARRFADAGLGSGLRSIADLRKVPILTKREIRAHAEEMISQRAIRPALMESRTGGSTGVPLILRFSEEVSELRNAAARRSDLWTGWKPGEPVGALWGNPKLPQTLKEHLRNELLDPILYLDTMTLSKASVEEFAISWKRERPTLLFGHAHSIYLLARTVEEFGIEGIQPKTILSTSMMLLAPERHVVERVFGVRVFDRYGCEEVGLIGCECERHTGMHVNIDHLIVEILREDGEPAAPGEIGYIVVTDLVNDTMPFIRYRVEDCAAMMNTACSCGRTLPLMDRVAGRVADFLRRADGTRVAGISLIENSLTKFDGIDQLQIVQESLEAITLNVVPAPTFDNEARPALVEYFQSTFPGSSVDIRIVPAIPREANGKFRFSICRVAD